MTKIKFISRLLASSLISASIAFTYSSLTQSTDSTPQVEQPRTLKINPKGSYFPNVIGAEAPSTTLITSGDILLIGVEGEYSTFGTDHDENERGDNTLNAVFKDSNGYVPFLAVDGFTLYPNHYSLGEDVPDFRIAGAKGSCAVVQVPEGATHLSFSTASRPRENISTYVDSDEDFRVSITNLKNIVAGIKLRSLNFLQGAERIHRFDNLFGHLSHFDNPYNYDFYSHDEHTTGGLVYRKKAVAEIVLERASNMPVSSNEYFSLVYQIKNEEESTIDDINNVGDNLYWKYYGYGDPPNKITTQLPENANCFTVGSDGLAVKKENCVFSKNDFDANGEMRVWIEFLVDEMHEGYNDFTVVIQPKINADCLRTVAYHKDLNFINSNLIYTYKLNVPKIGFLRVRSECQRFDSSTNTIEPVTGNDINCNTDNDLYNGLASSKELKFFKQMFPIPEEEKVFFQGDFFSVSNLINRLPFDTDFVRTVRENGLLLEETNKLAIKLLFNSYDYVVAVGSPNFFINNLSQRVTTNSDGKKITTLGVVFHLPPPYNKIAFVRSDRKDKGTILHELAHVLGQRKDFYIPRSGIIDQCTANELGFFEEYGPQFNAEGEVTQENRLDEQMACHSFNGRNLYRKFLEVDDGEGGKSFQETRVSHSIMSAESELDNIWIDRSTYKKAYETLSREDLDPQMTVISGVYSNNQFFNAEVNQYGFGRMFPSPSSGDIQVMLKDKDDNILHRASFPSSYEMKVLKDDGVHETVQSSDVPVFLTFPYAPKATQALVMKDGNVLFSKTMTADNNPDHLLSEQSRYSNAGQLPSLIRTNGVNLLKRNHSNSTAVSFSKFLYSHSLRVKFSYNACNASLTAGDGIALLFGKETSDYSSSLPQGNQGAVSNGKGLSVHLDMSGHIYLKDGNGQILAQKAHTVSTGCDDWEQIKVRIHMNDKGRGKLHILQEDSILLSYNLNTDQISQLEKILLAWSAYSSAQGQYRVRGIEIDRVPFPPQEEEQNN